MAVPLIQVGFNHLKGSSLDDLKGEGGSRHGSVKVRAIRGFQERCGPHSINSGVWRNDVVAQKGCQLWKR